MNYSSLKTSIEEFTENDAWGTTTQIDQIIENAQLRITRETDLNATRKYSTATMSANAYFLTTPSDMVVIRSIRIQDGDKLMQKDVSFLDDYNPTRTTTGTPRYYATWDHDTFLVQPAVSTSTTIELAYTKRLPTLSDSTTTNWLTDNAPDVLLYACLTQAATFMKGEQESLQDYEGRYQMALQGLLGEEDLRNRAEEYRSGALRLGATSK